MKNNNFYFKSSNLKLGDPATKSGELAKFNIKYYSGSQLFEYTGTTDIRFIPPLEGLLD